ncbi:MAG TPA: bifunctional DNA-formamidopyrimidine glycosylase/DNA-(apurinic or apyrimidinic site) lyase [Gemmatimonadaceae bacterium]|nr:bifunctional DNA-formamidopyrimidine glycosylase/DNA-(apurinic or apyrimidinic site) lyase [Gemmatimonadaceae bacterium]
MPELPETETIARDLDAALRGARISRVTVRRADVLRETQSGELARRLTGASILSASRRAKLVVIELSTADRVVVQPRFTGALIIDRGALPECERRYVTVSFVFDDGRALHYRDIRRLGTVALMDVERWQQYSSALGAEPLDPAFTPAHLSATLRDSRQAVKKALMDQRRIAGVGNIYANEALWRARIDPSRQSRALNGDEVRRLHASLTAVLREAIDARGTSFRDYRDASGERGTFAASLAAYGRAGEPCWRCGARLIGTSAIDGRATVFCARCQS